MKFHWGDCPCDGSCLSNEYNMIQENISGRLNFTQMHIKERDKLMAKNQLLTDMVDKYRDQIEKKDKQICNLELYLNELSAKLKIANDKIEPKTNCDCPEWGNTRYMWEKHIAGIVPGCSIHNPRTLHEYGESLFNQPIIEDGKVKWVNDDKIGNIRCSVCEYSDIISAKNIKTWFCPRCKESNE